MKCSKCEYSQIRQYAEDDFNLECEPPNGVCPYQAINSEKIKALIGWYKWYRRGGYPRFEAFWRSVRYIFP
jgi:hypothetical protein